MRKHPGPADFTLGLLILVWASQAMAAPNPEVARGAEVFRRVGCWQCHGTVGQGGAAGPKLAPGPLPLQAIQAIVRRPLKEMPPYARRVLSDDEVGAIHAYLSSIKPAPDVNGLEQLRPRPIRPQG